MAPQCQGLWGKNHCLELSGQITALIAQMGKVGAYLKVGSSEYYLLIFAISRRHKNKFLFLRQQINVSLPRHI